MKISDAKQIPVQKLTEQLGGIYSHTDRKGDHWYHSPFRPQERTASFKINEKLNTWHDFGLSGTFAHQKQGSGGDILDLWCDFHFKDRRLAITEALQGLEHLGSFAMRGESLQHRQGKEKPTVKNDEPTFKILKIADKITHYGLLDELQRRRVSLELADLHLKQGHIQNTVTKREYIAFLFANDKGGYEVSIPNPKRGECFKTSIGAKGITYAAPYKEKNSADVFEGFWDYLSWLEIKKIKHPINHSFVLNSNSFAADGVKKITGMDDRIKYVFLFLDNDVSGYETANYIASRLEPNSFKVANMNGFYVGYKDMNEFWTRHRLSHT